MKKQDLLFENLKRIKDHWVNTATSSLEPSANLMWSNVEDEFRELQKMVATDDQKEAFKKVLNDIIMGVMHSTLVMIDGGDALADNMKIDLVDFDTGESLKENTALHEEFYGYLLDNE
jgi:hypothetical protein